LDELDARRYLLYRLHETRLDNSSINVVNGVIRFLCRDVEPHDELPANAALQNMQDFAGPALARGSAGAYRSPRQTDRGSVQ